MPEHSPRWIPTTRLDEAFMLARLLHAGQSRKTADEKTPGIPYISHLMTVAALVIEHGGTEDQAIAALLHDAIEDTSMTMESLTFEFGGTVGQIVDACSDHHGGGQKKPWKERKEEYLSHLRDETDADDPAILVALADKVHNATCTELELRGLSAEQRHEYWKKFSVGEDQQRWWYQSLAVEFDAKSEGQPWAGLSTQFSGIVARMFP